MSKFLHDDDAKAIAIPRVFSESSQAKIRVSPNTRNKTESSVFLFLFTLDVVLLTIRNVGLRYFQHIRQYSPGKYPVIFCIS